MGRWVVGDGKGAKALDCIHSFQTRQKGTEENREIFKSAFISNYWFFFGVYASIQQQHVIGLDAESTLLLQNLLKDLAPFVMWLNNQLFESYLFWHRKVYSHSCGIQICYSSVCTGTMREKRGRESSAGLKQALVTVQLNKQMFSLFFDCESTGIQQLSQDICSWRPRLNLCPIGVLPSPLRPAGAVQWLAAPARAQKEKAEPWEFSETFSPLSWLSPTSASNQS